MRYKTEFKIKANLKEVFAALHQYKIDRRPGELFGTVLPSWLVKIDFRVLTSNTLGLGAVYNWKFKILGIPILKFKEKVVEWKEGKSVAYQAISGWKMFFRTELEPSTEGTLIKTEIDFSPMGFVIFDWLFSPVVKWGLNKVYKRMESNIEMAMRNRNYKMRDEEEKYYSWLKKTAGILAPYYDTVAIFISRIRNKVVDFTNARNGSRILDVGTGTGKQAFAFAKKGYDVIGVDLSEDMLNVAYKKNKYGNVKFEVADATNLPFEDNSFDVSCVSFALHDMPSTIREKALKEMARVTKPKGMLVIVDYALPKSKISKFLIYHFVKLYEKYYPEFIKSDLEALLRKSGIEVKEELPVLLGAGRVLKGIRIDDDGLRCELSYEYRHIKR